MRILLLAPHPFFQDRGTPIAVNLMLKTLSERGEEVDVVTFHEGSDVVYDNVNIYRIPNIFFVKNIRPGFSLGKIICDFFMIFIVFSRVFKKKYDLIHSVEESVFMAMLVKFFFRIPYIYDMDSSLAQQMVEKMSFLKPLARILNFAEGSAVRHSLSVVAVCEALAQIARKSDSQKKISIISDVSLVKENNGQQEPDLKKELNIQGLALMYIGNLETYQGIDLLLESFQKVKDHAADLIIIGGVSADIQKYQELSRQLGIKDKVHFVGPKPIDKLGDYLKMADILVSPRTKGNNTPMKIYSYLGSGKPVLATDLPTHTQVLNSDVALLSRPTVDEFSKGMSRLIVDEKKRASLGAAGKRLVDEEYSIQSFQRKVNKHYDWVKKELLN